MRRFPSAIVIPLIAVFLSGVLLGGLGYRLYMVRTVLAVQRRNPEEWRKSYVSEMKTRLHLNAGQTNQLDRILDETRSQYDALRKRHRPEMKEIHDAQISRITEILDPAQRLEYQKFRAEREKLEADHRRSGL